MIAIKEFEWSNGILSLSMIRVTYLPFLFNLRLSPLKETRSSKQTNHKDTLKQNIVFRLDVRYFKMVWKIGYNILASWCINRFLFEWDLFAKPMNHMIWDKCDGSCFSHYNVYVAPNCNPYSFPKGEAKHTNTCYSPSHCLLYE